MALRYYTPSRQQYVSTFVPMPVDFIANQLMQKQAQYDKTQQLISSAEDVYGGREVASPDIAYKNKLIEENFGKVHDLVAEKYSGDYGQAFNEIQNMVGKFNKDPFWNMSKQRLDQDVRERERRRTLEMEGTLVTNPEQEDPFSAPIRRGDDGSYAMPEYSGSFYRRDDYASTIDKNISEAISSMAREDILQGTGDPAFLQNIRTTGLSTKDLDAYIARDPDAFNRVVADLMQNPAFRIEHGKTLDQAEKYVKDVMKGQISEKIDRQVMGNPRFSFEPTEPEGGLRTKTGDVMINLPKIKIGTEKSDNSKELIDHGQYHFQFNIKESQREKKEPTDLGSGVKKMRDSYAYWANKLNKKLGEDMTELRQAEENISKSFINIQNYDRKLDANKAEPSESTLINGTYMVIDSEGNIINENASFNQLTDSRNKESIVGKDGKFTHQYKGIDKANTITDNGHVWRLESNGNVYALLEKAHAQDESSLYKMNKQIIEKPETRTEGKGDFVSLGRGLEGAPVLGISDEGAGYEYYIESYIIRRKKEDGSYEEVEVPANAIQESLRELKLR